MRVGCESAEDGGVRIMVMIVDSKIALMKGILGCECGANGSENICEFGLS